MLVAFDLDAPDQRLFPNPVDTRRRFNVYKTPIRPRRRRIDVL